MTGSVRIIAGRWRRRRLPVADVAGLRPTPDRVRETLFSWLQERLPGARCLDLFAGSGALGLEAASRGAREVVMVEAHPRVVETLRAQLETLGASHVDVIEADALRWLAGDARPFDIVFLDPPFGSVDLGELCAHLERGGWLAPDALVYVESHGDYAGLGLPAHWRAKREQRAGQVRYYLAAPGKPADDGAPTGDS